VQIVRSGDGPAFRCNQPEWLQQLLLRAKLIRTHKTRIGPEDESSIRFADLLREAALMGRLRATFTHIPHEVGGGTVNARLRYSLAIAMGLITGSADFVFVWKGGGCWIELKRPTIARSNMGPRKQGGTLTPKQKLFKRWCEHLDVPHHVVTSAEEGLKVLVGYGVLDLEISRT
jgi:hypothetical protein